MYTPAFQQQLADQLDAIRAAGTFKGERPLGGPQSARISTLGRDGVLNGQKRDPMPPAKMMPQSGASVSASWMRAGATDGNTVEAVPAPPPVGRCDP